MALAKITVLAKANYSLRILIPRLLKSWQFYHGKTNEDSYFLASTQGTAARTLLRANV
jgi:hypothetical protein